MRNKPGIAMSDLLYTRGKKPCVKWTESEHQKFYDAVREFGRKPYEISNSIGSKTYFQVSSRINKMRN